MLETGHLPHSGVKYGGLLFAAKDALGDQEVSRSQAPAIRLVYSGLDALEEERSGPELFYWIGVGRCRVTEDQHISAVVTLGEFKPEVRLEKVM